jgi:hypothetical protein
MKSTINVTIAVILLIAVTVALAAVPQTINYQGYLKDAAGAPVSTATSMTFSLYSSTSGAGAVWNSNQGGLPDGTRVSVTPVNGVYSVELGVTPQPALPAFDRTYWLGVAAGADPEMRPLQPLSSSPYALRAAVAEDVRIQAGKYMYTANGSVFNQYRSPSCSCDADPNVADCLSRNYTNVDLGPVCYDVYDGGGYVDPDLGYVPNYYSLQFARSDAPPLLEIGKYGGIGINTTPSTVELDVNGTVRATQFFGNVNGNATNVTGVVGTNNGGTGITSQPTTAGQFLRSSAAGSWGVSTILLSDIPDLSSRYAAVTSIAPPQQFLRGNTISTVDSTGTVGQYTSITIGTDGMPVISYHDYTNGTLKVAKCANAACSGAAVISTVDSVGNLGTSYSSITIGTDGMPVISYNAAGVLRMAKCANAACSGTATITTVDNGGGTYVGEYSSITIGTDGLPVISYYDYTNSDLKVAKCVNATCSGKATITTVDSIGSVGIFTSIAIATDGLPVISYYTNGDLNVAKCINVACSGSSTINTVDSIGTVGSDTSITIGTDGFPVISYYDLTNHHLKVVKCENAACSGAATITTVDNIGSVGLSTAITIGTDGIPRFLTSSPAAGSWSAAAATPTMAPSANLRPLDFPAAVATATTVVSGTCAPATPSRPQRRYLPCSAQYIPTPCRSPACHQPMWAAASAATTSAPHLPLRPTPGALAG